MESNLLKIANISTLGDRVPTHASANNTDLVIIKYDGDISIFYGRCHHRGALLADGYIEGNNLICGVHNWDYRFDTGVSEYNNDEALYKFTAIIKGDDLYIDENEILSFEKSHPQPFQRDQYLGIYADTHPEATEPYTLYIKELSQNGLKNIGHHGFTAAMGVDRNTLPKWEDIQFLPAQLATRPLQDHETVSTKVVIGPKAKKPLVLEIPLLVSDMSFGALSREAKISLAKGAEIVSTGICSGEGGMLPEEQGNNTRYLYELASAKFGFSWDKIEKVQAFHFKGGQGAKTGTGGHLPGEKVTGDIARVRNLPEGKPAISPATFIDMKTVEDFRDFGNQVRNVSGGIPIGFKIAASHIEDDIQFALDADADYIILDGRGGGTGATPTVLRDNINVPTIPALARARKYLDTVGADDVTLIITGGLRIVDDFAKALMLGADAVAVSNAAIQAIGCIGMRACNTNNCPVGIATQKEHLRSRLDIDISARQLANYFSASNDLIKVIARACGYDDISKFNHNDLSTFNYDIHRLTNIKFSGLPC
jgi:glutamate synthase domain-containing protein 2/nitrite reductase/ring-hydroxylating ferredoxin subunit